MPYTSPIPLAEERFAAYIAGIYSGNYPVRQAFSTEDYSLPMILVKAGQFVERFPGSSIFEGRVAITVFTQVDDDDAATVTHDNAINQILTALRDEAGLVASVSEAGSHFKLFGAYIDSYDTERGGSENARAISSVIELVVNCQTVA